MTATVDAAEKAAPKTVFLKDYTQPPYWVKDVYLDFNLGEFRVDVTSRSIPIERNLESIG